MYCRGPLPDGHPRPGVVYFCPDGDIALLASNLGRTPLLSKFSYTEHEAVLLEAHRAPDEWFAPACKMPQLLICGDPNAWRPRHTNLFANELEKQDKPVARALQPHACMTMTMTDALPLCRGRSVILCGSFTVCSSIFRHIRPQGLQVGDGAMDKYGRYTSIHAFLHGSSVSVDGGRRVARIEDLDQHVVVCPSKIRGGEYDTIIVMPDVPEKFARAVCHRLRYMVIGVSHSPLGYLLL